MKYFKLDSFYDLFILVAIIFKFILILVKIKVRYLEFSKSKSEKELKEEKIFEEKIDFIALGLIYILIIYVFWPTRDVKAIKFGNHEQILFFAAGIVGLLNLDYSIPLQFIQNLISIKK